MKNNKQYNPKETKGRGKPKSNMRGKQGRKDSSQKRVNLDNARESKVEQKIEEDMGKASGNNPEDWNANPELLKSAGSLPFAQITGNQIFKNFYVPGILIFDYTPSIGDSPDGYPTAINKMFREDYSFIVHANSRTYKYNSPDLGILTIAGIEVFAAVEELKRAFGAIKFYSEENRYTADTVVASLGFDPQDLRNNLGQAWFDINTLIMQTKQIWVPKNMRILARRLRMGAHIYTDASGFRSQIYVYRRKYFWKYSENSSITGGSLYPVQFYNGTNGVTGKLAKWKDAVAIVQGMIDALLSSEDRGIIYGDILKAYGAENIFAMDMINADYIIIPEHNQEILMQIENTVISPVEQRLIVQDQSTLESNGEARIVPVYYETHEAKYNVANPVAPAGLQPGDPENDDHDNLALIPDKQVLNVHFPGQPEPVMIMLATRMKSAAIRWRSPNASWTIEVETAVKTIKPKVVTTSQLLPDTTSSELVTWIGIVDHPYTPNSTTWLSEVNQFYNSLTNTEETEWANGFGIMAFDWHPFIYGIQQKSEQNSAKAGSLPAAITMSAFGDYDNYLVLDDIELNKLHDVAIYSVYSPTK